MKYRHTRVFSHNHRTYVQWTLHPSLQKWVKYLNMSIPSKTWTTPCNFPRKLPSSHQLVLLLHTQRRVCLAGVWAVDIWGMEANDTVWEEVCKEECFQCLLKSSSDVLKSLPICHRNTLCMWLHTLCLARDGATEMFFSFGSFLGSQKWHISACWKVSGFSNDSLGGGAPPRLTKKSLVKIGKKPFKLWGVFVPFLGGVFLDRLRKESKESWTLHPAWDPPPAPEPLQPVPTLRSRTSEINLWKNIGCVICIWVPYADMIRSANWNVYQKIEKELKPLNGSRKIIFFCIFLIWCNQNGKYKVVLFTSIFATTNDLRIKCVGRHDMSMSYFYTSNPPGEMGTPMSSTKSRPRAHGDCYEAIEKKLTEFCWIERKSLHLKTLNSFECLAPLKHGWVLSLSCIFHLLLHHISTCLPFKTHWCFFVAHVVPLADGKHLTTSARSANVSWWPNIVSMFLCWNAWLYCATWLNLLQWHFTILQFTCPTMNYAAFDVQHQKNKKQTWNV